ncbi:MAG: phosphoribosylglycinamide formyltransferase [Eubacteriales bacterium]|nr:phosphoribosylglycinamide formyltransferase [Eubacteriales bacterium]
MVNIAVLVSGGGTNLQAILDAQARGEIPNGRVCAVVSSKEGAYALERAQKANVPAFVMRRKDYASGQAYADALEALLRELDVQLVVLAGFMTVLAESFCHAFENRIINVHPALIPSFCGDGFYGLRVHEAALAKGVKVSGATVHFVNAVTDGGPIIAQKAVEVCEGDTPERLQKRIMEQAEWKLLPQAISDFCDGKLSVVDGIVHHKE